MTLTKSNYAGIALAVLVGVVVIGLAFINALPASANPLLFFRTSSVDQLATSSLAYMTPGTATTTKYYDTGASNTFSANQSTLTLQFVGSSTASNLNIVFEFANAPVSGANCRTTPTACDWYADRVTATSSTSNSLNLTAVWTLSAASSTVGGAGGTSATTNRIVSVATPSRYIRAVITMPIGSLNGAVWAEFVGRKEVQ